MPTLCIFCDNKSGSREHLWPDWILQRKTFGDFRFKRVGSPEVILTKPELKVKAVCGKCNNGWMSKLEGEAKPILERMFDNRPMSLDAEQQRTVATWITKMGLVFDSTKGRKAPNVFYQRPETIAFAVDRAIPQFTLIWIGHLDESHRAADGADFSLFSPHPTTGVRATRIGRGTSLTLTNEHFVAQIVSLRLNEAHTHPTQIDAEPKPGDWGNMLIQIWPMEKSVVDWPPKVSFMNGGPRGYQNLKDRWKIGDQVKRVTDNGVETLDQ